jgi:hypothetical protein
MRAFRTGIRPSYVEIRGVGVVAEGAGDEDVEAGVAGLARGGDEVGPRDGAVLVEQAERAPEA